MAVLTLSRQFGAGGKTLADNLAKRLGYTVATEAIIEDLAESANVSKEGLVAFEAEHAELAGTSSGPPAPRGFIERILDPRHKYMDGQVYASLLGQILPKIADRGDTIILGRGAQFVLKNRPDAYHVLLVADRQYRIRFLMETYGLTSSEADRAIAIREKRRAKLMRLFHHEDFDEPWHYDMVINMGKVGLHSAVELICDLISPPVFHP